MKVYDKKTLWVTVILCPLAIVFGVFLLCRKNLGGLYWVITFTYLLIRGLKAALSEEYAKKDRERTAQLRQIYQNKFGRFAPIAPLGPLLLILAIVPVALLWRADALWAVILLLIMATVYQIWLICLIYHGRKEIDRENE